ncbi:hypothetical protein CMU59_18450 [Elizabethkingia anophelis]|nr:hypothetical protein [Elizabethkingia anophelis]MDV3601519.1 hypothetical protein [Elizabethkingia anophelis]MDV3608578.1 hypothetical protein [Elizabethkingia anophelis]MDV3640624.1 hypothetical protein [Elizabethkingia anophelis]MDV3651472.1 hypothetical protein [Elizabethkingia anophelis]
MDRGFVRYEMVGKSRCYFPVVQKKSILEII